MITANIYRLRLRPLAQNNKIMLPLISLGLSFAGRWYALSPLGLTLEPEDKTFQQIFLTSEDGVLLGEHEDEHVSWLWCFRSWRSRPAIFNDANRTLSFTQYCLCAILVTIPSVSDALNGPCIKMTCVLLENELTNGIIQEMT